MSMTPPQAGAVYDVLIQHAGASPTGKAEFMHHMGYDWRHDVEYRFIGSLGFGGKFRIGSDGRWYVDCYREDLTAEREEALSATNTALSALQQQGES